ncbi:hypothetical protein B9Z55_000203 [Caenorhabditis nigoni]|uniref:Uncharacterized protein n=1 Tax=Caenorhabditis nigoni TaxID=1611254 RepID=A0A2G5VID9_9PELO|nr:hypothetical protein B9Z55_000203 [Caenorhabditis nigoni]
MSYGPQLPAWLTQNQEKETEEKEEEKEEEDVPITYGPVIPGQKSEKKEEKVETYGPVIPKIGGNSNSKDEEEVEKEEDDDDDEDYAGASYGPSIPSNFRQNYGPALPGASGTFQDDSDDEIGPMPVAAGDEDKEAMARAYRMVMQKEQEDEEKNSQPKREEWMTSVPKKLGNFGLGARTFKKGTASERDSTWEDAPGAKKKRRGEEMKTAKSVGAAMADARQEAIVAGKTQGPSLLELHQKHREEKVKDASFFMDFGPIFMDFGPFFMNFGPFFMNFGPFFMDFGPFFIDFGPFLMSFEPFFMNFGPFFMDFGPIFMDFGPFFMNFGPFFMNFGPFFMDFGPFFIDFGPFLMSFEPFFMNFGPFFIDFGPFLMSFEPFFMIFGPFFMNFALFRPTLGYTPGERRPFDREKDMEVRGLKPGGSKDAVEKMKELQGRFANSKEKKFL